ncbi:MAG: MBL fold metallo-hydrolase [Nitrospiria bacterium]
MILILLFSLAAPADAEDVKPVQIGDGVYVYDPGNMYISMFVVTPAGVIVIEPVNSGHSKGMLKAIRSVTDQPIRYLLPSHNHWDHANGGQVFRDEGATIVSHVEAYEWMRANPHPDLALPDESWAGNRKDIVLGGTTLELHYLGMNHGLGMTVFRLPKEKIVYIADLVAPNRVLFGIAPDFNITCLLTILSSWSIIQ